MLGRHCERLVKREGRNKLARSRNIKPGFFSNDVLAEIEPLGRLLFAGLWTIADRDGRLEDRPKRIKIELLPYDDCDAEELLQQLASKEFIIRYEANGDRYIQITNFKKHQNPHKNERPSEIPPPQKHAQDYSNKSIVLAPEQHSTNRADSFNMNHDSLNMNPLTESINPDLTEKSVDNLSPETGNAPSEAGAPGVPVGSQGELSAAPQDNPEFMKFWNAYPRKTSLDITFANWNIVVLSGCAPQNIIIAATFYAAKVLKDGTPERFQKSSHKFLSEGVYLQYMPKEARCPSCPEHHRCKGQGWWFTGEDASETAVCPYTKNSA
jgi:hypothetical protein